MKRGEWHTRARRMRASGVSIRSIADQIGVSYEAVYKVLHPERAREYQRKTEARPERKAAKREWDRLHSRGTCSDCGGEMGQNSKGRCQRCASCENARRTRRRTRKAHRIEAWWAEGLTLREIGERLGLSKAAVGVEMAQLRNEGFDLPYRRDPAFAEAARERTTRLRERKAA